MNVTSEKCRSKILSNFNAQVSRLRIDDDTFGRICTQAERDTCQKIVGGWQEQSLTHSLPAKFEATKAENKTKTKTNCLKEVEGLSESRSPTT